MAPFSRCKSSADNRPIDGPIRSRRIVVILSTATQDEVRKVSVRGGSIRNRVAGASVATDVNGQTITLSNAPNRSDWTITPGRGLPVKSPLRSAIATTSPRATARTVTEGHHHRKR
jgi:hypothetical protein